MIVEATNCNRTFAAQAQSLAADFVSAVVDFKDMPMGSVQVRWAGAVAPFLGSFKIYGSNLPEVANFDLDGTYIDCSEMIVSKAAGSRIWIRDRLAFRYALVRYVANGVAGGTVDIIALGKKS